MTDQSPPGPAEPEATGPYADVQPPLPPDAVPFDNPYHSPDYQPAPSSGAPPAQAAPYQPGYQGGSPPAEPAANPYGYQAPNYSAGYPAYPSHPTYPNQMGQSAYPPYPAYMAPPEAVAKNGWGVASLVLSIVGMTVLFGSLVPSVLGVIFGHLGLSAVKRQQANNKGVAAAGLIVGYIGLAVSILVWLALLGLFAAGLSGDWSYYSLGSIDASSLIPAVAA